ncbi:MAG: hypothetical protein CMF50_03575 [Legionellales bacterium]|nr:hypothetical protein [Legionellales bacterium]|tara:strand:+ start:4212 stop:11954 length:7743 start_codon:yes stop_codon:yes gene_type:complete
MVKMTSCLIESDSDKPLTGTISLDTLSTIRNQFPTIPEDAFVVGVLAVTLAKCSYDEFHIIHYDRAGNSTIYSSSLLNKDISLSGWLLHRKHPCLPPQANKVIFSNNRQLDERCIIVDFSNMPEEQKSDAINFSFVKNNRGYEITCSWAGEAPFCGWSGLFDRFNLLLCDIVNKGDKPIGEYSFLTSAEKSTLTAKCDAISAVNPMETNIIECFKSITQQLPNSIAIEQDNVKITYHQLDVLSDKLASQLTSRGTVKDQCIAIYLDQQLEFVIAVIAILKAGAAYVPLDVDFPIQRIKHMINDSQSMLVLTSPQCHYNFLSSPEIPSVTFTREALSLAPLPDNGRQPNIASSDNACVMYTSGSTGKPKGVCIAHKNIVALARVGFPNQIGNKDAFLNGANVTFDASLFNLWGALLNGARYVVIPQSTLLNAEEFEDVIQSNKITMLTLATSLFNQLVLERPGMFATLTLLFIGGEQLQENVTKKMIGKLPKELWNGYGPTECTLCTTRYLANNHRDGVIPIGKPLPYAEVCLFDRFGQPLPSGLVGELYITGAGVSAGYIHAPEKTAAAFIPALHPSSDLIFYKTGDLAFCNKNNDYVFVGRKDHQVKIAGQRIELGEVEHQALRHPGIQQCVALAVDSHHYHKRLVLFYRSENNTIDGKQLQDHLSKHLPTSMIPKRYYSIDQFPLTATGKVNRQALMATAVDNACKSDSDPEKLSHCEDEPLAAIWKRYLQVASIAPEDNFFALGGDSITAIQICSAAREVGIGVQPTHVLESRTFSDFLTRTVPIAVKNEDIKQPLEEDSFPLSPIQHWFFDMESTNPDYFTMSYFLRCKQTVDFSLFADALATVLSIHPSLFVSFDNNDGKWQQHTHPPILASDDERLVEIELPSHLSLAEKKTYLKKAACLAQESLSLEAGRLFKVVLFQERDTGISYLFMAIHHVVMDGVSWRILLDDLSNAYHALSQGKSSFLPPEHCSFATCVKGLQDYSLSKAARQYWDAITDSGWQPVIAGARPCLEADLLAYETQLDSETTKPLITQTPSLLGVSINAVLLTALSVAINKTFGVGRFTLDVEGHGREAIFNDCDISRTVGWFTILYPVTLNIFSSTQTMIPLDKSETLMRILTENDQQLSSIPANGFDYLPYAVKLNQHTVRPQVKFNYLGRFQNNNDALFMFDAENKVPQLASENHWPYLLDVELIVIDGQLSLSFKYDRHIISAEQVAMLSQHYTKTLMEMNQAAQTKLSITRQQEQDSFFVNGLYKAMEGGGHSICSYSLSPMHASLLFHAISYPESSCYVVQTILSLSASTHLDTLKQAFSHIIENEPALRSFFKGDKRGIYSYVVKPAVKLPWHEINLSALNAEIQEKRIADIIQEDRAQGFDCLAAPLFRITALYLGSDHYKLLFSFHHLILDGWSINLLLERLNVTYHRLLNNKSLPFNNSDNFHQSYLAWLSSQNQEEAESYWQQHLDGMDEITRIPFKDMQHHRAGCITALNTPYTVQRNIALPAHKINHLLQANKVTVNTLMLSCFGVLLQYLTGSDQPLIGLVTAERSSTLPQSMTALGLYINTVPFRFDLSDELPINEFLQHVQQTLNTHMKHSHYPLHRIKRESRFADKERLFEILYVFENYPNVQAVSDENIIDDISIIEELDIPLAFLIKKINNEDYIITALSHAEVFPQKFIERFVDYYLNFLDNLIAGSCENIHQLRALPNDEIQRLLQLSDGGYAPYPKDRCLYTLIEEQMAKSPTAISVSDNNTQWTYRQLQQNTLAYGAMLETVSHTGIIAVALERQVELVAAMLGALTIGAAFLPLDVTLPPKRIGQILTLAKTTVVITDEAHKSLFDELDITIMTIEQLGNHSTMVTSPAPEHVNISASDIAYVIYTSGSTGIPKGVMVSHCSLLNRLYWMTDYLAVTAADKFLQKTSISFDVSLWEIFTPLLTGGTLVLAEPGKQSDPDYLLDVIQSQQISIMHFVPSMLTHFMAAIDGSPVQERCQSLRAVVCSGEALTPATANAFNRLFDKAVLYNFYGPTEAAIEVSYWRCPKDGAVTNIPIGKAIANTALHIMNKAKEILPENVVGELVIAGGNVAKGYLYNEELTSKRFMIEPYKGEKAFYTGDLAYRDSDGFLYYLGRCDGQIKVRGCRVELSEVEYTLSQHPNISTAAVIYDADNDSLIAHIVEKSELDDGINRLTAYNRFLTERLPRYMLPSHYEAQITLPLTTSGKVDKRSLSALQYNRVNTIPFPDMSTSIVNKVKALCEIVLKTSSIDWDDNFFYLGGHSLCAIELVALIDDTLHISIKTSDIFAYPVIQDLAAFVEKKSTVPHQVAANNNQVEHIIKIKIVDNAPNLFLIHPIGGTVYRFQQLSHYLSSGWNLYGIEDPGLYSDSYIFPSLESMADFYVHKLQKIQPSGPYHLGGLSFGGTVAVEMAEQLQASGEVVSPVVLLDAWAKYPAEVSTEKYVDNYINSQYAKLASSLEPKVFNNIPKPRLRVHRHRARLLEAYQFTMAQLPDIVLFKALDLLPVLQDFDEPYNYWQELTSQDIAVYSVPGDHDSMFSQLNIRELAAALDLYLAQVAEIYRHEEKHYA